MLFRSEQPFQEQEQIQEQLLQEIPTEEKHKLTFPKPVQQILMMTDSNSTVTQAITAWELQKYV